jgi:diguanylate cyclase (GGDEF)-like protein
MWTAVRPAAERERIVACWTIAIQATDRSTLGLLTVFCREPRRPCASELQTLDMVAQLAAICIEHHNTTRRLGHLVRHDPLTGLPNRVLFEDRLQHALDFAARTGNRVAIMVLDIDKFKSVNDSFGHLAGDHLLQHFAQRLRAKLRQMDTMARIGGDEFVIVLPELKTREDASLVAQKLVDALHEPFEIAGRGIPATTSIGIATYPEDGSDAVTLQKQADDALYRVKERGRNGFGY